MRQSKNGSDRQCLFGVVLFGVPRLERWQFYVFKYSKPFCIQKIIIKVLFFPRSVLFFLRAHVPQGARECLFVSDGRLAEAQQYTYIYLHVLQYEAEILYLHSKKPNLTLRYFKICESYVRK